MPFQPLQGDALLIVDVQKDFLPGGQLAVPAGNEVVAPLNDWIARFASADLPVFATRDWHPADHCSFQAQGGPWPPHCVAETEGAEFADGLELPPSSTIIGKATHVDADAYSGFAGTNLHQLLQQHGVNRLFIGGLATDYCVLNSVRDALKLGYKVHLLMSGMRAVNVNPEDGAKAIAEMIAAGAVAVEN